MSEIYIIVVNIWLLLLEIVAWLFSEKSSGVLTLITGIIAIWVYKNQLKNKRLGAARVLYLEIKDAERDIDKIKSNHDLTSLEIQIMPIQSWNQYRTMLSKELTRDQQDEINIFYSKCQAATKTLNHLRSFLLEVAMKRKAEVLQEKLSDFANEHRSDDKTIYEKHKKDFLEKIEPEDYWFLPKKAKDDLLLYLNGVSKVTNTVTG